MEALKAVKTTNKEKASRRPNETIPLGIRGYPMQRTGRFINEWFREGDSRHPESVGERKCWVLCIHRKKQVNGFKKLIYWTKERLTAHAKRYSKSYSKSSSAWQTNFDEMALKTMLRNLLSKYGVMSVEMVNALTPTSGDERRNN